MLTSSGNALLLRRLTPALVAVVLQLGCNDANDPTPPLGGIRVVVVSTGADVDPDGYAVRRDDGSTTPVPANGEVSFESLSPGRHRLRLNGIATNCTPEGGETQVAVVEREELTQVTFRLICAPRVGSMRITMITTGLDLPTSYTLSVDGGDPIVIGPNESRTITPLREGGHAVSLGALPSNCVLTGSPQRDPQVPFAATAHVEFRIACARITGALRVTVTTTGTHRDPDGYRVDVTIPDFYYPTTVASLPIGEHATVTFPALPVGDYQIVLSGVAPWCTVTPPGSMVSIVGNATVDVGFTVNCMPPGTLRISVTTSGLEPDPDGYRLRISSDNLYELHPLAPNGSFDRASLRAGPYVVQIEGLADNCTLVGASQREIDVPSGAIATVVFEVQCRARGSLRITNVTSGPDPDPNGYEASLQLPGNTVRLALPAGGQVVRAGLAAGEYELAFQNIAENCRPASAVVRRVVIEPGVETTVAFDVSCAAVTRLAFVSSPSGNNTEIYTANSNGTGLTRLTTNSARDEQPAWSPNGQRIAFISDRASSGNFDIYIMNADGSGVVRRTTTGRSTQPAWSPDGRTIAFVSMHDGDHDIYTMAADDIAAPIVRLTNNAVYDSDPSWSPDGRIAFTSNASGPTDIWVMNADGTGHVPLSRNPVTLHYRQPAWSPDGRSIAFAHIDCSDPYYYYCTLHLSVMNADGSGVRQLVPASDSRPAWSPDGRTIAFDGWHTANGATQNAILYVRVDGSHQDLLIAEGYQPAWRR